MTLKIADRLYETTATTGTGNITMGGAVQGFQAFSVIGTTNKTPYYIDDADVSGIAQNWEAGIGTVTVTGGITTLSRDTILASSNANIVVNFGIGTKNVRGGIPAAMLPVVDENLNSIRHRATATGGTANVQTATLPYVPLGYSDGMIISMKPSIANTTAGFTVNVNGKGAKSVKYNGADPGIGAFSIGVPVWLVYNATTDTLDIMNQTAGIAANQATAIAAMAIQPFSMQGRLTLTSATPVTTADVSSVTRVYWTPWKGQLATLYNGTAFVSANQGEIYFDLDATNTALSLNYEAFMFLDGGVAKVGYKAWASTTSRGTGGSTCELERFGGVDVNKNAITVRQASGTTVAIAARAGISLGAFYPPTTAGQLSDALDKRVLWNRFNQAEREIQRYETTASWAYSSATFRYANANAANGILLLDGDGTLVPHLDLLVGAASGPARTAVSIGLDGTTPDSNGVSYSQSQAEASGSFIAYGAHWNGRIGLGAHTLYWLESAQGTTFYGNGNPGGTISQAQKAGLVGHVKM